MVNTKNYLFEYIIDKVIFYYAVNDKKSFALDKKINHLLNLIKIENFQINKVFTPNGQLCPKCLIMTDIKSECIFCERNSILAYLN